ncbi:MAG: TolC family protein [Candidatus Omnitrophica bacterium]|nr:TolC family protein [Candidatus Omnitrophota bacterium]MCB9720015.1 TolC family protein [Candidatus Omnitrophota bacterium]
MPEAVLAADPPTVTVGVVIDGPWKRNNEIFELLRSEVHTLTDDEFAVRFPADKSLTADWTRDGVSAAVERLLNDPGVDIIIALGAIASDDLVHRGPLPKPVIAPYILDIELQNVPRQDGSSGVTNLSYVTFSTRLPTSMTTFHEVVGFHKLTLMTNTYVITAIPQLKDRIRQIAGSIGIDVSIVLVDGAVQEALAGIPRGTEAVFVAPQFQLAPEEVDELIAGLIERRLPSFSGFGRSEVERGMMVGLTQTDFDFPRMARRIALNLQRILLGEKPEDIPVAFEEVTQLTINMETARKVGTWPSWDIMQKAELIGENYFESKGELTLEEAISDAVEKNLSLMAGYKSVTAGAVDIRRAWATLFPQVTLAGQWRKIDEDRAKASLGTAPERTANSSATLTQILFNEEALANVGIQKRLQISREEEFRQLKLDIIQATAITYFNVLRAKILERIQFDNLKLSKANLELAEKRESVGQSGSADVYRWESQIATNRRDLLQAQADRHNAEIVLNGLLHRPLEDNYQLRETSLDEPMLWIDRDRVIQYTDNPWSFRIFRDFIVTDSLENTPGLRQLEALIKAKDRQLRSAKRDFWLPDITFQANVTDNFYEDGAGQPAAPVKNDRDVSAVVQASYPLFEGGDRVAEVKQLKEELAQLTLQRDALMESIEQDIRTSLRDVGASHGSIRHARKSAAAAGQNLELITDAYARGSVSIIELLDAQNASLVADQVSANAVYDFMIDFMVMQRNMGYYMFMLNEEERREWLERLAAFFSDRGITVE